MNSFPAVTTSPLLTPPNLLSLTRFPMAAAFVAVDHPPSRLLLLGLASVSDVVDGWLARRRGEATPLGALLDPIADKTFVLVAISTFLIAGEISVAGYFIFLSRDFATALGFLVAWRLPGLDPLSFRARWPGKLVTVLQLLILASLIVLPAAVPLLIPAIGAASALAIADYTLALHRSRIRR